MADNTTGRATANLASFAHEEMRRAISRRVTDKTEKKFRVIPVALPGVELLVFWYSALTAGIGGDNQTRRQSDTGVSRSAYPIVSLSSRRRSLDKGNSYQFSSVR